jgi:hypothetical protein
MAIFEAAHTPALLPFLGMHGKAFHPWRAEASLAPAPQSSADPIQGDVLSDLCARNANPSPLGPQAA